MNAIELLMQDHAKLRKILDKLESTTSRGVKTRKELISKGKRELKAHEAIEEQIFYPALKEHPKAREIVLEGYEEHHAVDVLLAELESVPFGDESWGAKFTVIKENIEHHIEEEEAEMFGKARQVFSKSELAELGDRMKQAKVVAAV